MSYKWNLRALGAKLPNLCRTTWPTLTILATKFQEDESFWKNALYDQITHKILYKIGIHTYVLQIEPNERWAENCQSGVGRHGRF